MNSVIASVDIGTDTYDIIGDSVIGGGKKENQDSFSIYYDTKQIIVAVADGLGSAKNSKLGSMAAVRCVTEVLNSDDLANVPKALFDRWKSCFNDDINSFDTTCKFIKIAENEIVYGGIGDGWIAINYEDEYLELSSENVFSNQTTSMLSFNYTEQFITKIAATVKLNNLLISTDGFSEDFDKNDGKEILNDMYEQVSINPYDFKNELHELLYNWKVKTNMDDKTVVVIHRREKNE